MDPKLLEEIGLTPGEVKVYLALLKIGQSSTGAIAKESQVSRSKLYMILDKLAKKGLVGHVIRGEVQNFTAMEPKRLLQYMEDKNKQLNEQRALLEKIMPELELQQKLRNKTEATLFEGIKAIKNFYLNILDELPSNATYYVIGASYGENRPGINEFFQNFHTQRASKNIKVKMLANNDVKRNLVPATNLKSEIRFLPQYLVTDLITVFDQKKVFIFYLTEEPKGFLLESEAAAKSYKKYFDTFWRMAKK